MNVSFDKTDRLIELIEDSIHVFSSINIYVHKWKEFKQRKPDVVSTLEAITKSDLPETEKDNQRAFAYAVGYNLGGNIEKGKAFLKIDFDDEAFAKYLTRAYWQIQGSISFAKLSETEKEKIKSTRFKDNLFRDEILKVLQKEEPTIADVEKEFWFNCPDVNQIKQWCNIYRERWRDHLKHVDEKYYNHDAMLFDDKNEVSCLFRDLRKAGLLQVDEAYIEFQLEHIAWALNYLTDSIVSFFTKLKASSADTTSTHTSNDMQTETLTLEQIFKPATNAFSICKELMDEYELTLNGKPNPAFSDKALGKLTGIISAMKDCGRMLIFNKPTDKQLLPYFNLYLNKDFKSFSKRGADYKPTYQEALAYIKKYMK